MVTPPVVIILNEVSMRLISCTVSALALLAAFPAAVQAQAPAAAATAPATRTWSAADFFQTRSYGMASPSRAWPFRPTANPS